MHQYLILAVLLEVLQNLEVMEPLIRQHPMLNKGILEVKVFRLHPQKLYGKSDRKLKFLGQFKQTMGVDINIGEILLNVVDLEAGSFTMLIFKMT